MRLAHWVDVAVRLAVTGALAAGFLLAIGSRMVDLAHVGATADVRLATASQVLASAIGPSGGGVRFFAVQRNLEYAREGGATIAVVDPADPRHVIGQTTFLEVNAMLAKGAIASDGFFMEMRLGAPADQPVSFDSAPQVFRTLQSGGTTWRNDGAGWYVTDAPPGMGIDPASARSLPRLLSSLIAVTSLGSQFVGGVAVDGFGGTARVADYPGAVAADGASFTESSFRVEAWLDTGNRPIKVVIRARNLNQTLYDLIAETTITLDYTTPDPLPAPDPTLRPEPAPTDASAASN